MGFFRKLEDDIKELGRDIDDNILQPIKENPIGAIVSVGGMALGIPPVYAGALGGAANAAANDGDILKGALLGGATGYIGGAASGAAASAGAGQVLSSAAGGAAAGAAGAAFTGQDIGKGALFGGLAGAASGYVKQEYFNDAGGKTYTYDDGSTLSVDAKGNPIGYTNRTDGGGAPVFEYNSNTGRIEPVESTSRSTQALNELSVGETQDLINRNVQPGMIDALEEGVTGGGGGGGDDGEAPPFRVEIRGTPATADNPNPAIGEYRTPGTELATWDQIDKGLASYNTAANAWEVNLPAAPAAPSVPAYTGPESYIFDDGTSMVFNPDGNITYTDTFGKTFNTRGGQAYDSGNGSTTYRFDDGSWMTLNADGSSVVADSTGKVTTNAGGTYSGAGTGGQATDLGELVITAPRIPTDIADMGELVITAPRLPGTVVTPPTTTTTGGGTTTDGGTTTTPGGSTVVPLFPIITPGTGGTGGTGGGTVTTPGGPIKAINLPGGLNPGFINPTPFYNTTNDAQSKFSWGARAFQPGPVFDADLYNSAPAPQTPWGIQQIAQPLTPEQFARAAQGLPVVQAPGAVATRAVAPRAFVAPTGVNTGTTGTVAPTFVNPLNNNGPVDNVRLAEGLDMSRPLAPIPPAPVAVTPPPPPRPVTPTPTPVPASTPAPVVVGPSPFVVGPTAPVVVGPVAPVAPAGVRLGDLPINNLQLAGSLDMGNQSWAIR